jgi:hypothetical protein
MRFPISFHRAKRALYLPGASRLYGLIALAVLFSLALSPLLGAAAQGVDTPENPQAVWNYHIVDSAPLFFDMTDRSLRFGPDDVPRIAYGGDHLYYAWLTSGVWNIALVDASPRVGQYAALALDASGNPRISYYDATNRSLKFAFSQGNPYSWTVYTIDTPTCAADAGVANDPEGVTFDDWRRSQLEIKGLQYEQMQASGDAPLSASSNAGVGLYTSIAVDSLGVVHISYYDQCSQGLKYARWDGSNPWHKATVDANPSDLGYDMGKYSSIAVGSDNLARISYLDEKYDGLRYAWQNPNLSWDHLTVESFADGLRAGGYSSLVLDGNNNPAISHIDWTTADGHLRFARYLGGGGNCGEDDSWRCVQVDGNTNVGYYSSLARNSSGTFMISYFDDNSANLKFASSSNGTNWSNSILASDGVIGLFTSIAVNSSGNPGIAFYSATTGGLYFTAYSGSWSQSLVATSGDLGLGTSLAINNSGTPYITYVNDIADVMKMAVGRGLAWQRSNIYTNGSYSSIKLNSASEPRIALYDMYSFDLVFAYLQGGVWYYQTLDSTGDVGQFPSLALDPNGRPHITYYDASNGWLKYIYYDGSNWVSPVVLDSSANVGQYSSLVFSRSAANCLDGAPTTGFCPFISYYDATNGDLKIMYKSQTNAWVTNVIESAGTVGQYGSMVMDFGGNLQVVYYDASNGDLRHATGVKTGSSYDFSGPKNIVDSAGDVGQWASLAVDGSNNLHASYYDAANGNLKYALRQFGTWSNETVDSAGVVGQYTSIGLDPTGKPGISYYDFTNGDLKFVAQYTIPATGSTYLPQVRKK